MNTCNVFAVPAIFKELDRKIILKKKEQIITTEQELLNAYLNVTYPSLKRYADFYEFEFKFLKEIPFNKDLNIPLRSPEVISRPNFLDILFSEPLALPICLSAKTSFRLDILFCL